MEPKIFQRKKLSPPEITSKFPSPGAEEVFIGVFNGYNVTVHETKSVHHLYDKGNFGKGSLSKSKPNCQETKDDLPMILTEQQWENQLKWKSKVNLETGNFCVENADAGLCDRSFWNFFQSVFSCGEKDSWRNWKLRNSENYKRMTGTELSVANEEDVFQSSATTESSTDASFYSMVNEILLTRKAREANKICKKDRMVILVIGNSESCQTGDNFIDNIKVSLKNSVQQIKETLKLNLSEAFFLCFALGSLKIVGETGNEMSINDVWSTFCEAEENFIEKYIVFHHYRSYNWTVKSGLKFSGDYLLYKIGPSYYHASYLVWILDKKKKMSWNEYIALNRLVESFNKDLLLCEIIGPKVEDTDILFGPDCLQQFSILEMISRRWIPTRERGSGKLQNI